MADRNNPNEWGEARQKLHEARLSWYKAASPLLMVFVAAVAAYWGVDRHAQGMREAEHDLETFNIMSQVENERSVYDERIRSQYLTKAIESPDDNVRLKYLRYLSFSRDEAGFREWASKELELVQVSLGEAKKRADDAIRKAQEAEKKYREAEAERISAEIKAKVAAEELQKARKENVRLIAEKRSKETKEALEKAESAAKLARVDVEAARAQTRRGTHLGRIELANIEDDKKYLLYHKTIATIALLLADRSLINKESGPYKTFWELYRKDLIGYESPAFAKIMVEIGKQLFLLRDDNSHSDEVLKELVARLRNVAAEETKDIEISPWARFYGPAYL